MDVACNVQIWEGNMALPNNIEPWTGSTIPHNLLYSLKLITEAFATQHFPFPTNHPRENMPLHQGKEMEICELWHIKTGKGPLWPKLDLLVIHSCVIMVILVYDDQCKRPFIINFLGGRQIGCGNTLKNSDINSDSFFMICGYFSCIFSWHVMIFHGFSWHVIKYFREEGLHLHQSSQAFLWYDKDYDLKTCVCMVWLKYVRA